ncbi:MAG TPA: hypothetical protein VM639_13280 [Dongiaceae bacterium]|nr:hypothetical protein [Dongiaceae bacterium]
MSSSRILDDVSGLLRAASRAIEDTFVGIGNRLESAIEILDRLSQTFDNLQRDLSSEDLAVATQSMGQVAKRIAALAIHDDGVPEALQDITAKTVAVGQRLNEMHKAVKAVDVLAVNAKIAAAHISSAGEEFISFADEIAAALKVAEGNLTDFGSELGQVIATLRDASRSQAALRQRQADAATTVPRALQLSVTTIGDRNAEACKAATVIQEKTGEVARQVGIAVTALQIGDSTRQRIEHVEYAIGLFQRALGGTSKSGQPAPQSGFTIPTHLETTEREAIAAIGAELQVEQLADTAGELDSQLQRILAVLTALTGDAHEMAALARRAYGASGIDGGTFLDDLGDKVGQANELLQALTTAQHEANGVVQSVMTAAGSLTGHMKSIQSLESDIRLMGLNTTLKCSRLGNEGRSLTVIAQELRSCSNITASEAEAIMELLDAVTVAGTQLSARETGAQSAETQAILDIMRNSIDRLHSVGGSLTGALATLSGDTERVVTLLDETLASVTAHQTISDTLRRCATALAAIARPMAPEDDRLKDVLADLQATLFKSYTMVQERKIHARVLGSEDDSILAAPMAAPAATSDADLEDMLF